MFPDLIEVYCVHLIRMPPGAQDIPLYFDDKTVLSEVKSVYIVTQTSDGKRAEKSLWNM